VQFHPTAMDFGIDPAPLATEALRGEGARLIGADGAAFEVSDVFFHGIGTPLRG